MNKSIIFYTLAALALTACSSADSDEQQGAPSPQRPFTVVVSEAPFVNENGEAQAPMRQGTRGTVVTTATLTEFKMYSSNTYYQLSKDNNGLWTSDQEWPTSVGDFDKITFYAYNVGHHEDNTTNKFYPNDPAPHISFTVPQNASSQTDLLVAKQEKISYDSSKGQVSLTFDHACAAVDFTVCISSKLQEKLGGNLTVNSIRLENVADQGDYYFSEGWKNVTQTDDDTYYTLTTAQSTTVNTTEQSLPCGTLFLIPQKLGSGAQFAITYTLPGETSSRTATIDLDGESWQAGYQYPVNIYLGTAVIQVP